MNTKALVYSAFTICLLLAACEHKKPIPPPKAGPQPEAGLFVDTPYYSWYPGTEDIDIRDVDSVTYVRKSGIPPNPTMRFFLVTYSTMLKGKTDPIMGDIWFNWGHFPSKLQIDSLAYSGFPLERKCYQSIIITNIVEFKNERDFDSYKEGYSGNLDTNKRKKKCCDVFASDTIAFHEPIPIINGQLFKPYDPGSGAGRYLGYLFDTTNSHLNLDSFRLQAYPRDTSYTIPLCRLNDTTGAILHFPIRSYQ